MQLVHGMLDYFFHQRKMTFIIKAIKGFLSFDLPTIPAGRVAAAIYHT
jgi:hypothetical protein